MNLLARYEQNIVCLNMHETLSGATLCYLPCSQSFWNNSIHSVYAPFLNITLLWPLWSEKNTIRDATDIKFAGYQGTGYPFSVIDRLSSKSWKLNLIFCRISDIRQNIRYILDMKESLHGNVTSIHILRHTWSRPSGGPSKDNYQV